MNDDRPFPEVTLPARLDRAMRLGPFASARDALKFVAYAAVGAVGALLAGPVAWLPFLGGGFLLTVYRPDGTPLDERAARRLRYAWRGRRRPAISPDAGTSAAHGTVVRLRGGGVAAGLAAGGVPVTFLPPAEARELFLGYARFLSGASRGLHLWMGTEPLADRRFRPAPGRVEGGDAAARHGYDEMVRLLCRRRHRRRVELVVALEEGPTAAATLDREVDALGRGLADLGVASSRLAGPSLDRAIHRLGWAGTGPP